MSNASMSTTEMIQALRDHLEQRVLQSEDYRALVALDRHLAACESIPRPAEDNRTPAVERRRHLRLLSFAAEPANLIERGGSRP